MVSWMIHINRKFDFNLDTLALGTALLDKFLLTVKVSTTFIIFFRILSHLCGVDVSYETRLHLTRSCASSPDNSLSDKSFLMSSNHLHFGLPLLLFPGTYIILFPGTYITISLLPTYICLFFSIHAHTTSAYLDISPTFVVPLVFFLYKYKVSTKLE